jgi:AAA family ATP:ADP antiporter
MGIQGGVRNLQWVFTGTFVAMLVAVPIFGAVAARFPRQKLLPIVYYFFIINLLIFYVLLESGVATTYVARAFFIWVSVFNLFVISVFWSFMADLFTNEQARRLFGFIAAGGSAGAIVGPSITAMLVRPLGTFNLLLISAVILGLAVVCIRKLGRWAAVYEGGMTSFTNEASPEEDQAADARYAVVPVGGGVLSGFMAVFQSPYLLGICLYIWLYTTLSTFLYFEQAHIVKGAFADSASRTEVFAYIDLAVNSLTVIGQVLLTAKIVARFGLPFTLALLPGLAVVGFIVLGLFPSIAVLIAFQIVRRAGNYGIARPAREMLYTVVGREEKYKSKNFIDTVVYRGGDAVSGWVFTGLQGAGLSLSAISFVAVPIATVWLFTGWALGKKQETLRIPQSSEVAPDHVLQT